MSDDTDTELGEGDARRAAIAEYVLGLLEGEEHEAVARAIAADPELAAEAQFWEDRFAGLNAEYAAATPPPQVLARIEARLFAAEPAAPWYASLLLWRAATGMALAAALLAIGLSLFQPAPPPAGPDLVAALQPVESDLSVVALYDARTGLLRLTSTGTDAGAQNDYELWMIVGEGPPVSMGVLALGEAISHTVAEDLRPDF